MPPFLLTLTTWFTNQRTRSIHERAAAKEKPATTAFKDCDSSSWLISVTVSAADMVYITFRKFILGLIPLQLISSCIFWPGTPLFFCHPIQTQIPSLNLNQIH